MDLTNHADTPQGLFFDDFEFDPRTRKLTRNGLMVPLPLQPARVLSALLLRAGQIVTREELRREVWSEDVYVDFDDALNHNIKFLRDLLGDDAPTRKYIETVPKRGYRFIAQVKFRPEDGLQTVSEIGPELQQNASGPVLAASPVRAPHVMKWWPLFVGAPILLAVGLWAMKSSAVPHVSNVVQLTRFGLAVKVVSDGTHLYVEQERGGLHSLVQFPVDGKGEPIPLPTPFRNAQLLDISPDGKQLLIASSEDWNAPRTLWTMPLSGGSPRRLSDATSISAKWSQDGSRIAFEGREGESPDGLYLMNGDGSGPVVKVSEIGGSVDSWAPDGKWVRITRTDQWTGSGSLWEVSTDGQQLRPLLPQRTAPNARWGEGQCCGQWTPDKRYFIFREALDGKVSLWASHEDQMLAAKAGQPSELYAAGFDILSIAFPSPSAAGNRVFVVGQNSAVELMRYDKALQHFLPFVPGLAAYFFASSPDQSSIAYSSFPDFTLWRARADGSKRVQLSFSPMQAFGPVWSPDGKRLAFHGLMPQHRPGKVCIVSADGGSPEILFANEPTAEDDQQWSPDGETMMFKRTWLDKDANATASSTWMLDLKTRSLSKLPASDDKGPAVWSPDGRYVVAQSKDFQNLMLYDFRSQKWSRIASGVYIHGPRWSSDSLTVYYQDIRTNEDQPIYRFSLATNKNQVFASREQILRGDVARYRFIALTRDNEPVVSVTRSSSDVYALDLDLP